MGVDVKSAARKKINNFDLKWSLTCAMLVLSAVFATNL
jgi:hypothetical protein